MAVPPATQPGGHPAEGPAEELPLPVRLRLLRIAEEPPLVRLVLLCAGLHQERAEQQAEELEEPAEERAEVAKEMAQEYQELAEEPAPPVQEPGDSGVHGEDSATDVPGSHLLCAVQVPSTVLHVVPTAVEPLSSFARLAGPLIDVGS